MQEVATIHPVVDAATICLTYSFCLRYLQTTALAIPLVSSETPSLALYPQAIKIFPVALLMLDAAVCVLDFDMVRLLTIV